VAVVGVPDPFLHQEICACVVLERKLQDGVAKVTKDGEAKEEEDSAVLKKVEQWVERDIVVLEDDPLSPRPRHYPSFPSLLETSTGKLRRREIKNMAAQRLGLA
jgi:acyl-CoA synthetase (AMP-forming)/AMP-acid ligase II